MTIMERVKIKKKSNITTSRIIFVIFNTTLLLLLTFSFIAPYINILAKAFNTAKDTMLGGVLFTPRKWTLDNFAVVLQDASTWSGLRVSLARVIIGSLFSLLLVYSVAYVLLQKNLPFKKVIVMYFTIPMFISGGLVSQFITYAELNVYNTFLVYILPTAFSFYNMVVIRTYLQGIPESLMESARIDGAS